jgi:predicted TIM-barrel fold metal-dependent hydrolase
MNRRVFIRNAALAAATAAVGCNRAQAQAAQPSGTAQALPEPGARDLIDSNVYVSRWPYRRVPYDKTSKLVQLLKENGVASAWTGSFDALLHRDVTAVNARLANECASEGAGILVPFGAVNPTLPDWEEDLRRCHEVHRMPGIRLHPDFHGYAMDDPLFVRLMEMATARGLIVQIALGMEDPRTQPPTARFAPPHPGALADLLPKMPKARVVLLNFFRSFEYNRVLLIRLSSLPQVSFDMAMVEGVAGLSNLLGSVGSIRLLFGSYAPFYNFDSARLKMQESILGQEQLAAIRHGNATALLQAA